MNVKGQNLFLFILLLSSLFANAYGNLTLPNLPPDNILDKPNHSFIDPNVNYEEFMGRVTDKDDSGRVLKIKVENNNTKFFKAGDVVYFRVNNHKTLDPCRATVRNVENFYFTLYVQDFRYCWSKGQYFPRGVQLNFSSKILGQRVFEASKYREILLLRKDGFLNQLNNINNFLWNYNQQKIKTAAEYDEEINSLKRKKQLAIDNLLQTKQENLMLQVELQKKLDSLDESLKHYRVERQEYLVDRWDMDHESGVKFPQRPMKLKKP